MNQALILVNGNEFFLLLPRHRTPNVAVATEMQTIGSPAVRLRGYECRTTYAIPYGTTIEDAMLTRDAVNAIM